MNTNPESRPPLGETCSLHQKLKQPIEWTSRQRHSTLQKLDNWNILMLKQRNCELARKKNKTCNYIMSRVAVAIRENENLKLNICR
jgi:hypothetical protein